MNPLKIWMHFFGLFACFLLGAIIGTIPRIIIGFEHEQGWVVFLSEILRIISTIIALVLYSRYLLIFNLNQKIFNSTNFKPIKWGTIGIILPAFVISVFWFTGNLTISFHKVNAGLFLDTLIKSLGMALAAAILEELIFRGYLIAILKIRYGMIVSAVTPSLLFVLLHLGGVNTILGAVQLLIAGLAVSLMFLIIRYNTGSIWNASMVHFFWNFIILNDLIRFQKNTNSATFLTLDLGANTVFNGGEYGIEASIPAILTYVVTSLVVWRYYKNKKFKNWGVPEISKNEFNGIEKY